MPSRSQLPGNLSRTKFTNALKRLGFEIKNKGGGGDYKKVLWPQTQKLVVVPRKLRNDVLYYLLQEIEKNTNGQITWDDIKEKL